MPPSRHLLLNLSDEELLASCTVTTYRASGPGGQHRNTTDSAVRLTLNDTDLVASAADERSQHRNRKIALSRLRLEIGLHLREEELNQVSTLQVGKKDKRYPELVGQIFDSLHLHEYAIGDAARAIGQTTGKLIRFLAHDPHLWAEANRQRQQRDLHPFRMPK